MHTSLGMQGIITGSDVVKNLRLIWREFGPSCLLRCVAAVLTGRHTTFLELTWGERLHLPGPLVRLEPPLRRYAHWSRTVA